jgi:hypothetical protein
MMPPSTNVNEIQMNEKMAFLYLVYMFLYEKRVQYFNWM